MEANGFLKEFLFDRYSIDLDDLSPVDILKILEIAEMRNGRIYCDDENHPGVYHLFDIASYTSTTIKFRFVCVYSPVYGVANVVEDLVNSDEIKDAVYL